MAALIHFLLDILKFIKQNKKASKTSLVLISTIIKLWLQPFDLHTRSLTIASSAISFPFFPFSPDGGSSGASFLFRPACFHAFLPIPVLSFLQFLSPPAVSPHSGYLSVSAFFLSVFDLFPLAFALGSGYSASEPLLIGDIPSAYRLSDAI